MKGKVQIYIREGRLKYKFELKRNITIINGDSGSGKSTLFRIIQDYNLDLMQRGRSDTVVECGNYKLITMDYLLWGLAQNVPENYCDSIIIIDEQSSFVKTKLFAKFVADSKAYFIIINRNSLKQLAYSVNEIYNFITKHGIHMLKPVYLNDDNFYIKRKIEHKPVEILTEDSGVGFEFFDMIEDIKCISAGSNSNMLNYLSANYVKDMLIVGDGAAFGAYIKQIKFYIEKSNSQLYLPESFEYLMLDISIFGEEIEDVKRNTFNYAEGCSWEQFYAKYLKQKLIEYGISYQKRVLPDIFKRYFKDILLNNNLGFLLNRGKHLYKMNIQP